LWITIVKWPLRPSTKKTLALVIEVESSFHNDILVMVDMGRLYKSFSQTKWIVKILWCHEKNKGFFVIFLLYSVITMVFLLSKKLSYHGRTKKIKLPWKNVVYCYDEGNVWDCNNNYFLFLKSIRQNNLKL